MYILRIILINIVCITGIIICLPNILNKNIISYFPSFIKDQRYNLGIDLQGGSQIILEIDFKDSIKKSTRILLKKIKNFLKEKKISYHNLKPIHNKIYLHIKNSSEIYLITNFISNNSDIKLNINNNNKICIQYSKSRNIKKHKNILDKSIEIIESRINELGTKEPKIQRQGKSRIIVQIPGYNNPKHIKKIIGKTANMSFHFMKDTKYINHTTTLLTGEHFQDVQSKIDTNCKPYVQFTLDSKGSEIFYNITKKT